jgi:hypothetical protein
VDTPVHRSKADVSILGRARVVVPFVIDGRIPAVADATNTEENAATRGLPAVDRREFICPHSECATYAMQVPGGLLWALEGEQHAWVDGWTVHRCSACKQPIFWRHSDDGNASMIYPVGFLGEPPNDDMPQDVRGIYEEARQVAPTSRRSAAALLRLALQMLVDHLDTDPGDINKKIGRLVQRGLHPQTQQAMDVLRVVGNHAVHPGQIDLDDDPILLPGLFRLANVVVDQMISIPKHAQSLFDSLPPGARAQIEKRDGAGAGTANP